MNSERLPGRFKTSVLIWKRKNEYFNKNELQVKYDTLIPDFFRFFFVLLFSYLRTTKAGWNFVRTYFFVLNFVNPKVSLT